MPRLAPCNSHLPLAPAAALNWRLLLCVTSLALASCAGQSQPDASAPPVASTPITSTPVTEYLSDQAAEATAPGGFQPAPTSIPSPKPEVISIPGFGDFPSGSRGTGQSHSQQALSESELQAALAQEQPGREQNYQLNASGQLVPATETGSAQDENPAYTLMRTSQCQAPSLSNYQKSLVFFNFPRSNNDSSKLGQLYQVEQHLPLLIGANLFKRQGFTTSQLLDNSFANSSERSELDSANQLQALARQFRAQYFITGAVDDMSLTYSDSLVNPGLYTRFVSGVHDLFHFSSRLDRRSRVFSFSLQMRDSITGQLVFARHYQTFGKWNAGLDAKQGFASPEFWATDYGRQVQQLVAKASAELAASLNCQPFMARVDARVGQDTVVIQSGSNNGVKVGDALELYQLVYEPVTGQYQRYQSHLVKRRGKVYLTEVYPGHSIGRVMDEPLLNGQYVVRAL